VLERRSLIACALLNFGLYRGANDEGLTEEVAVTVDALATSDRDPDDEEAHSGGPSHRSFLRRLILRAIQCAAWRRLSVQGSREPGNT